MPDLGASLQTLLTQSNLECMRLCCPACRDSAPIAQTASGRLPRAVGRVRRALPPVRSTSVVARAVTRRYPARVGSRFANPTYPLYLSSKDKLRRKLIAWAEEVEVSVRAMDAERRCDATPVGLMGFLGERGCA